PANEAAGRAAVCSPALSPAVAATGGAVPAIRDGSGGARPAGGQPARTFGRHLESTASPAAVRLGDQKKQLSQEPQFCYIQHDSERGLRCPIYHNCCAARSPSSIR